MTRKRTLACLAAFVLTATSFPASALNAVAVPQVNAIAYSVETKGENDYFKEQLETNEQKTFYDALVSMLNQGMLAKGEDLDLVEADYFTSEEVEGFTKGTDNILKAYGAARDAFSADHPDLFYIDYSALSIRINTTRENGTLKYHLFLGSGRRNDYFTQAFKDTDTTSAAAQIADAQKLYDTAFANAVSAVDAEAAKLASDDGVKPEDYVKAAHDYLTNHISYRLEDKFEEGDPAVELIRTSYGALVNQKAVCEGYARSFKALMDNYGIPCILVQGAYRPDADSYELHMWTYVQIGDTWYAVDPTMDDPTNSKLGADQVGKDGYENHEYLLKGENKMALKYAPSGVLSESNFEFKYPDLSYENFGSEVVYSSNGLTVQYEPSEQQEGEAAGKFTVSYMGMGLKKAREAGYYIMYDCLVERNEKITTGSASTDKKGPSYEQRVAEQPIGDMLWTGMSYIGLGVQEPPYFASESEVEESDFYDTPEYLVLKLPQTPYVKFAVTKIKPTLIYEDQQTHAQIYDGKFGSTPTDQVAASDAIFNSNGFYKAPPYPTEVSPGLTSALLIDDGKREISAKFDQKLYIDETYLNENDGKFALRMNLQDMWELVNTSGYDHSTVENVRLIFSDGTESEPINTDLQLVRKEDFGNSVNTVVERHRDIAGKVNAAIYAGKEIDGYKFDFTPSIMYADDNIFYEFDVKGIKAKPITVKYKEIGATEEKEATVEGKEPIAISYLAAHRCAAYAYKSEGYDWNLFGKPTLLDDSDNINTSEWKDKDGNPVSEQLRHRMVLVATKPNEDKAEELKETLTGGEGGLGALGEAADLDNAEYYNINLTVCKSQIVSTGQAVRVTLGFPAGYGPEDKGTTFKVYHFNEDGSVNEIPCVITEYGLVVYCDSFSPFAIVPIKIDKAEELKEAGKISEEVVKELENTNKTVMFSNEEGGKIEAVGDVETKNSGTAVVSENGKVQITIQAEEGYDIDTVTVGNVDYDVTEQTKDKLVLELPYVQLNDGTTIVDAEFVAEKVREKEVEAGATVVKPTVTTHSYDESGVCTDCGAYKDNLSAMRGYSLTLKGNIGMNCYVEIADYAAEKKPKMVFTFPDGTTEVQTFDKAVEAKNIQLANKDSKGKVYKYTCDIAPAEYTDTITAQLILDDGAKGTVYSYSIKDYIDTAANSSLSTEAKKMISSLNTYSQSVHNYFVEKDKVVADVSNVNVDTVKDYAARIVDTNKDDGISYYGSSLILETNTIVRHYFEVDDGAVVPQGLKKKEGSDLYYYESEPIAAHCLGNTVNVNVEGFEIEYSPMSYVYDVLRLNSTDKNSKNLVKQLYNYYLAAEEYAKVAE